MNSIKGCRVLFVLVVTYTFTILDAEEYAKTIYNLEWKLDNKPFPTIDPVFLGVTLDALLLPLKDEHKIFESEKFINLARNLGTTYFRMGGTAADAVRFVPHSNHSAIDYSGKEIILDTKLWDKINSFVKAVGCWKFIFGLNALMRDKSKWDPSNALQLLQYSKSKGYKFDLELGNEPGEFIDAFGKYVQPEQLAEDFKSLKEIIGGQNNYDSPFYPDVSIYGPDLDRINDTEQPYLEKFLAHMGTFGPGGKNIIDRLTWHHYYVNGPKAKPEQFIDTDILDSLLPKITSVADTVANSSLPNLKIWLGEGSSAYNSGAPNISDRYIAGFMFLDKLGMCALHGVQAFIRQAFYYGHYAMVGPDLEPNPDYWIAVLFKRLVGDRVIPLSYYLLNRRQVPGKLVLENFNDVGKNVYDFTNRTSSSDEGRFYDLPIPPTIRVYAHCARADSESAGGHFAYKPGATVYYVMNLLPGPMEIWFAVAPPIGDQLHSYTLTAPGTEPDSDENRNGSFPRRLLNREIALNEKILRTNERGELPLMEPVISGPVNDGILVVHVPPFSYGFYVFPAGALSSCK